MLIEIQSSAMKLYFLIAAHALAATAILLISDFGLASILLKVFLLMLVAVSFKRCLAYHKEKISLYLKADDQVDLTIGHGEYYDLQLCNQSYASDALVQLALLDPLSGITHFVTLFPDAIDTVMHSRLRARFKLASSRDSTPPA